MEIFSTPQLWLILALVLIVAEVSTMSFFLIWPAIAAAILAILTWIMPVGISSQLIIFAVLSVMLTVPGRRWIMPLMKRDTAHNLNARDQQMIGRIGTIASGNKGSYRVKIGDSEWSALSKQSLKNGERVRITEVDGIIVHVEKD